ncbi:hypothetical protein ACHWQZ_G000108 [Mnemiopsis leidyi]|uniref:ABLIM class LIM protein ML04674a n=1 Tax=Mnemiopsis leidyi TaxID=27923 RepID=H2DJX0_MNELE|nr:ABLIM class LIM protein ML04674a [Mnemiopsis leidyi]
MADLANTLCAGCSEKLVGEVIRVGDSDHFHVDCFKCTQCSEALASTGFFARQDKYYCSKDYHELFGTRCVVCSNFIEGEGFTVQKRSYHTRCFKCSQCGGGFNSGSRVLFDEGRPICETCRSKTQASARLSTCKGCNKDITGRSVVAMDSDWHVDCFACYYCKAPLAGEYMVKDGHPYCEADYLNLFGQKCKICDQFIVGRVLQAGGVSYHNSCLRCQVCSNSFAEGQEIFTQDGIFWHTECEPYLEGFGDSEYFDDGGEEEDTPGLVTDDVADVADGISDLRVEEN